MKTLINAYNAAINAIKSGATMKSVIADLTAVEVAEKADRHAVTHSRKTKRGVERYCVEAIRILTGGLNEAAIALARKEADLMNLPIDAINRTRLYPETIINHEEAHAEALNVDAEFNFELVSREINVSDLPCMDEDRCQWLKNRWAMFWSACDHADRIEMVDEAHTEALRLAAESDRLIEYTTKNRAFRAYWLQSKTGNSVTDMDTWDALHAEALDMNARHFPAMPEAVALVDYLTAAIADGAGSLGGYVLRKGDKFYCECGRSFTKNPLKASYFSDKQKHLLPQFTSLYGMTALRLGDAVRLALDTAKADCEDLASQIATLDEVYDATATPVVPRRSKGHDLTEMHRADRTFAGASYGRKYQHHFRTDRYHTLTA